MNTAAPKKFRIKKNLPDDAAAHGIHHEKQTVSCPYCCAAIPKNAKKCSHCGEWIKEKQKSRTIYLLLTVLFGHLGIGEFYAGKTSLGASYLILTLLMFCILPIEYVGAFAVLIVLIAVFSNTCVDKEKNPHHARNILFFAVFLCLCVLAFFWWFFGWGIYSVRDKARARNNEYKNSEQMNKNNVLLSDGRYAQ